MVTLIAGQPQILRDLNEINILHLIREDGPISRIDISKKIGISQTAVSRIVARLMKDNFVKEESDTKNRRSVGRQPIFLHFNYSIGNIVAIDIGRTTITIALVNLGGKLLAKEIFPSDLHRTRDDVLKDLNRKLVKFLSINGQTLENVYGIGVTIPGIVKNPEGIIRSFGSKKEWINFNLREYFEKKYEIFTCIESDARAITLGEYYMGVGKNNNNMVCLCITDVGPYAGIVHNGQLIRGISDSAGELGTINVGYYIRQGYLFKSLFKKEEDILFDEIVLPDTIVNIARQEIEKGHVLKGPKGQLDPKTLNVLEVVQAAEFGDEFCRYILREFASILSALCINIINLYNPELIILNGEIFWEGTFIIKTIEEMVKKHILPISVEPVRFMNSVLKENRYVLGIASLVLNKLFAPPKIDNESLLSFQKMRPLSFIK